MTNIKITALPEATSMDQDELLVIVVDPASAAVTKKITRANLGTFYVPLTTPLTSTSWDGDAYSTTAKTLIDLSAVFGAPAGIKAIQARMIARDSGSSGASPYFGLSPNNTAASIALNVRLDAMGNDVWHEADGICPCDANGDVYYQISATGASTLDAHIQIWGYWV